MLKIASQTQVRCLSLAPPGAVCWSSQVFDPETSRLDTEARPGCRAPSSAASSPAGREENYFPLPPARTVKAETHDLPACQGSVDGDHAWYLVWLALKSPTKPEGMQ